MGFHYRGTNFLEEVMLYDDFQYLLSVAEDFFDLMYGNIYDEKSEY